MAGTDITRRGFVAAGALLLAGCGNAAAQGDQASQAASTASAASPTSTAAPSQPATAPASQAQPAAQPGASKIMVAYYSRADENYPSEWLTVGHTKVMAGYIADALGADSYEIVPAQAYPEGYDACCDQAMEEQKDNARPAIANALPDLSGYDVVFIGCPIWWGYEPMIVRTFLDGVDLADKTIVPFTTHAGTGLGSVPTNLKAAIPDARHLDGLAVAGTSVDGARDQVTAWAQGLQLA